MIQTLSTARDELVVREVFSAFPSGVVALGAVVDGLRVGMVASSFTVGVSLQPVLVSVAVQRSSRTWPALRRGDRIGVSILAEHQQHVSRALSARESADRFAAIDATDFPGGAIFVEGAVGWLECRVYDEVPAGDHAVVLLEVVAMSVDHGIRPLVFHRSGYSGLRDE